MKEWGKRPWAPPTRWQADTCEGFPQGSCIVQVPVGVQLCYYCEKTLRLYLEQIDRDRPVKLPATRYD